MALKGMAGQTAEPSATQSALTALMPIRVTLRPKGPAGRSIPIIIRVFRLRIIRT